MVFLQCSNSEGRHARADRRREHLLDVARCLFVARGFHATGVAQIAQESGVKVGQIYRDFACKEDIIVAIALRDLARFLDDSGLEEAIAAHDLPSIRLWIDTFVAYSGDIEGYRLMPEIMAESIRNPRIAAAQNEITDRVRAALMRALAACAPGDALADERSALADLILTLGGGLCQRIVLETQRGGDFRPLCDRLQAIVERELDRLCGTA